MDEKARDDLVISVLCKEIQDLRWKVELQEKRIKELEAAKGKEEW